jgi:hypothetical protein
MTMGGADVALPNRPRLLLRFLARWSASYLAPCLVAWIVIMVVGMAYPPNNDNPTLLPYVATAVWIFVWPLGLALGQWMLMRRHIPKAHFWALAIFAGALFERVSGMFMPHAGVRTIGLMPPLSWMFQLLRSMFGGGISADVLTMRWLPHVLESAAQFGCKDQPGLRQL